MLNVNTCIWIIIHNFFKNDSQNGHNLGIPMHLRTFELRKCILIFLKTCWPRRRRNEKNPSSSYIPSDSYYDRPLAHLSNIKYIKKSIDNCTSPKTNRKICRLNFQNLVPKLRSQVTLLKFHLGLMASNWRTLDRSSLRLKFKLCFCGGKYIFLQNFQQPS